MNPNDRWLQGRCSVLEFHGLSPMAALVQAIQEWREQGRLETKFQAQRARLSPYVHELNGSGTDCATDCPACLWSAEQEAEAEERERRTR